MEETKTQETTTTTTPDENLQPLWVQVPWGTMNKTTQTLQSLTGHVSDKYMVHALAEQLIRLEKEAEKLKAGEKATEETKTEVPTEKL